MAGTLFGIPMSQVVNASGVPQAGALLYVYEANSSTPADTYSDFALATVQTWPLEADGVGRIPAFYVDDGSYRVKLTTAAGVTLYDEQSITAIGASSQSSGGSVAQDTTTLHQTGDFIWSPVAGTRSGWVRANGRTIGSGSSGATERANSDTQSLFEFLWNNFSDSLCAVSGGRGASATADFNANKAIATLDMRSKTIFGLDTMGNSAASVTGGSSTAADAIGASTYTIVTANLPSTNLNIGSLTVSLTSATNIISASSLKELTDSGSGSFALQGVDQNTITASVGGTLPLGGSDTDLDILPPARVGTWYIKL